MTTLLLSKYLGVFGNLHCNQNPRFGLAPHKPILLLALLDEVERGNIRDNLIVLTPELVAAFRDLWRVLVPEETWRERIANPFRFLVQDGFWTLVKNGTPVSTQALGNNPTLKQLTTEVDGAVLEAELWQLLQDRTALHALRTHLLQTYFGKAYPEVQPTLQPNPIDYEVEKLKAEASSRFRVNKVSEAKDETGYYVRHALFPRVVKELYWNACAVCTLSPHTEEGGGLIDAAHILPFAEFHNDDPRNGIAFCKNHHWGFDAGWYTLSETYRVLVSPHLRDGLPYITVGVLLRLPDSPQHHPSPEALAWHRRHVYLR